MDVSGQDRALPSLPHGAVAVVAATVSRITGVVTSVGLVVVTGSAGSERNPFQRWRIAAESRPLSQLHLDFSRSNTSRGDLQ